MGRILRVIHRTDYRYDRPVALNPHRLMLRPRDSHDLWLDDAYLRISPDASLRWYFDTFGNSVAEASFAQDSDHLSIESELILRRYAADITQRATHVHDCPYPFTYSADQRIDLSPYLAMQNDGDAPALGDWLTRMFRDRPDNAFAFLRGLSNAIHHNLDYSAREEMGTQTAAETIARGMGTCRDYAFLFMEAARLLGFAARFVTGYLDDRPTDDASAALGGGATHAWADIFIPGEGWIEFDPTNRIVAGRALIRVATTRTPLQASPISGSFQGEAEAFVGLDVSVEISETEEIA